MRELGYQVIETTRAEEALHTLQSAPQVDLLFADLMLPGRLNGYQLGREATARRPGLRVLYTSAYAAGVCDRPEEIRPFLKKPYRDHELARAVAEALAAPATSAP